MDHTEAWLPTQSFCAGREDAGITSSHLCRAADANLSQRGKATRWFSWVTMGRRLCEHGKTKEEPFASRNAIQSSFFCE